ncbi:MAG: hypothetical protein RLY31_2589 [Bacteroidota bacterium]|jgi:futalosine hydrolase
MRLLLVFATETEAASVLPFLSDRMERVVGRPLLSFRREQVSMEVLVTGVGSPRTAFELGRYLATTPVDLAVNAGIAGSYRRDIAPGQVVHVISERFADLGVEERDGRFVDLFAAGIARADEPPFADGVLHNLDAANYGFLPVAHGLTVNRVHGSAESIASVRQRCPADVESMEGAAFFLSCLLSEVPFLEIRAVSNYVEPRNKTAWDIPGALHALGDVLGELLALFLPA